MLDMIEVKLRKMSYEQMIYKWRFAPFGDPMFSGEAGQLFSKIMNEKKNKLTPEQQSEISKRIGWD